jgi:hypothetical protein
MTNVSPRVTAEKGRKGGVEKILNPYKENYYHDNVTMT